MLTPFRTILLFATIILLGCFAITQLTIHYAPPPKGSVISISFTLSNAPPLETETKVTSQIENGLSMITGINKQLSNSGNGKGEVTISFIAGTDIQQKKLEIASIIRRLYPLMPEGCSYPIIMESSEAEDISKSPILMYSIAAPQQPQQIFEVAKNSIQNQLTNISDIKEVNLSDIQPLQIAVEFDRLKCINWGIKPSKITEILQRKFTPNYYGTISNDKHEYFVRTKENIENISILNDITIPTQHGSIPLKDIASIHFEEPFAQSYHRINGKNLITISIIAKENANIIECGNQTKKLISTISAQLPEGFEIQLAYDNISFLENELKKNFRRTALSIAILILFISLIYFNWSYAIKGGKTKRVNN